MMTYLCDGNKAPELSRPPKGSCWVTCSYALLSEQSGPDWNALFPNQHALKLNNSKRFHLILYYLI